MNVYEVNSIEGLQPLENAWQELLSQTPRASFFQSLPWLKAYWNHFGADQYLRALVVESEQEVVGIVPLVRKREKTKVGALDFLTYPMDHWGSFYGPLGKNPSEVLNAGIDYLRHKGLEADVLELRWVGSEDGEHRQHEEILSNAGFAPQSSRLDSTAVISLPSTWEEYLASRSGKWRNNYRRWKRRLDEMGEVSYSRYRPQPNQDADIGWKYYEECLRIAALSWQGTSTTGTTLTHHEVADFLQEVHTEALQAGCVDINLLYLDNRAVAFSYNYVYQGQVYGLRVGYDANVPCKGVGNLLYAMTIENSIERGDWRYDLGPRHLECKKPIMTDELPVYRLSCYKSLSVRQQLMRLKRQWDNLQEQSTDIVVAPVEVVAPVATPTK